MIKLFLIRLMALVYEALLLLALAMVVTALIVAMAGDASMGPKRVLLQLVLWLVMAAYFIRCWVTSGQTLPNQTWRLKVVNDQGQPLIWQQALQRYVLAWLLLLPAGLTFWWAIFDRQQCYLHDRILGTRLIQVK